MYMLGVLVVIVCVVAVSVGLTYGSNADDASAPIFYQSNKGSPIEKSLQYKATAFDQFEAGSNFGPGGRGWGTIGASDSVLGEYSKAAVSADGVPCAEVARDILLKNSTAADAAIAGMFCLGVINTQSMGLGGGFLATYYDRASRTAYTLDAREVAPYRASQDMFHGSSKLSQKGGLAVAVPGEVRGYKALYDRFGGGLPWADLVAPAIRICEEGYRVNWHLARALHKNQDAIKKEPSMSVFLDPTTGNVLKEGDLLRRPDLAATLRVIQRDPDALYTGVLRDDVLKDLHDHGSIIDEKDLLDYQAKWRDPVNAGLSNGGYTLYSMPVPGSGHILAFILNILDDFNLNSESIKSPKSLVTHQRIVEAFKYAYAKRTELGDSDFTNIKKLLEQLSSESYAAQVRAVLTTSSTSHDPHDYGAVAAPPPGDHGTSHFSLLAPNGDAVAVTSTINVYFGAGFRGQRTGIIFNDEMDDFSSPNITNYFGIPPSTANFIRPGKRPLSSMAPTVIVDARGDVRLVLGAAGGSKIPSGIANVVMHNLWFGSNIKQAIDARRFHHQLYPMALMYEHGFNQTLMQQLSADAVNAAVVYRR
ncbi:glutathione hydrolase 1 proenzyme isoform X2 [Hyalella azteca]|uniref:Glutathione hydrolase 1 proenzyme isoform X2 n=1 Tax=Hyalella azteca TaxID=294128 RepID=A0A8B7P900_HYAAZ|nr:glutathione hydrolase 1 proenzyme isoform X2 [Hyalella azteca]